MLSCGCGGADLSDYDWLYYKPEDFVNLKTKRRMRCCSCKELIDIGAECLKFDRVRHPITEIEERIYGEGAEIDIAPFWMCESCGEIFLNLDAIGYCMDIESDMRKALQEYHQISGFEKFT